MGEDQRNKLVAFVLQRCCLVVVSVPTRESARRIFAAMNTRGLDLEATDILKVELLGENTSLAVRWERVEQELGREKMVELFGHIRMIHEREKPREALETGFKKLCEEDPEQFIAKVLEPISDAFLLLTDVRASGVKTLFGCCAAKAIRSLNHIDNKDWLPPALLCILQRKDDSSAVADFLIKLERVAYFLAVTRSGVNERIARFAAIMDEFYPRPSLPRPKNSSTLSNDEQQRFIDALSGPIYKLARVCRPVLQRLNERLTEGEVSYDGLVSIEHVLPQTVDEGSEWARQFSDLQEREYWTHRLANLVFLTRRINSRASNWCFKKKKDEYFSSSDREAISPFPITLSVLRPEEGMPHPESEKWTPKRLQERQKRFLELLCKIWELTAIYAEGAEIAGMHPLGYGGDMP
jgi:hypothetical protein